MVAGSLVPTTEDSSRVNMAKGGLGILQGLGAHRYVHGTSAEHKVRSRFEIFFSLDYPVSQAPFFLCSTWNRLT